MKKTSDLKTLWLCAWTGLLLMGHLAFASASDPLSGMEMQLYGRDFAAESLEERLSRLEEIVFGQAQEGDAPQREERLHAVIPGVPVKASAKSAGGQGNPFKKPPGFLSEAEPALPDATDYPAVSQLEQRLFQQSFASEEIAKRLTRLEQKVFSQSFDELPMVDRVDQLVLKVDPNSPLGIEESMASGLPQKGEDLSPGDLAIYSKLNVLEEQVFRKTYGGELIIHRLSRLERQFFGFEESGSVDSRMQRLLSHYTAIIQRRQQGYAEAPQPYTPGEGHQPHPSQPVIINGGIGGRQFSPEMLEMLPAGVRRQIEAQGTGAVGGIASQNRGYQPFQPPADSETFSYQVETVIPYSPNPLVVVPGQAFRRFSSPSPYPSRILQPTQPQQPEPTQFPGGALPPLYQEQYSAPGIIGQNSLQLPFSGYNMTDNSLNQSLVLLESEIFGRSFEGTHIPMRLNQLEQQVFGRTYPQYSFQQRINRLMRRSTYRQSSNPFPTQYQSGIPGSIPEELSAGQILMNRVLQDFY